jgi:hypothetical protein
MDPSTKYQAIAIVAGMVAGIIASRRFKKIRYGMVAFVLVPQACVLGYLGKWEAAAIPIVLAIMAVMIDSLAALRKKSSRRRHR